MCRGVIVSRGDEKAKSSRPAVANATANEATLKHDRIGESVCKDSTLAAKELLATIFRRVCRKGTDHAAADAARSKVDPSATNLGHFHDEAKIEKLPGGKFSLVRKLANGLNGDIFKYEMQEPDVNPCFTAVKKIRSCALERIRGKEKNERTVHLRHASDWSRPSEEDALAEIGVLSHLASQRDLPRFVIKMYGAFFETNRYTWLVLEFADGGELFDQVAKASLGETDVKRYTWQTLQAVAYLHRHHIGHRDISLENLLLRNGEVRVMDFGMAVQSHSACGTPLRYFRAVGKSYYRSPECYIPTSATGKVIVPKDRSPCTVGIVRTLNGYLCEAQLPEDAVPGRLSIAEFVGYEVHPADVFAVGVCLFILCYGSPPWQKALLTDPYFGFAHKETNGLEKLVEGWNVPVRSATTMALATKMMQTDPSKRPIAVECLASPFFDDMQDEQVPVHPSDCLGLGGG